MLKVKLNLVILVLCTCSYSMDTIQEKPKLIILFLLDINKSGTINTGDRVAAAIIKSVNKAQEILPEFDLSEWEIIDSACNGVSVVKRLEIMLNRLAKDGKRIHGIIGPYCARSCEVAALFAGSFHIPEVSNGCFFKEAGNVRFYPTLTRVNGETSFTVGDVLINVLTYRNVEKLAILVAEDSFLHDEFAIYVGGRVQTIFGPSFKCDIKKMQPRLNSYEDPGISITNVIRNLLYFKRNGFQGKYCVYNSI